MNICILTMSQKKKGPHKQNKTQTKPKNTNKEKKRTHREAQRKHVWMVIIKKINRSVILPHFRSAAQKHNGHLTMCNTQGF